jgi:hypothetical protein
MEYNNKKNSLLALIARDDSSTDEPRTSKKGSKLVWKVSSAPRGNNRPTRPKDARPASKLGYRKKKSAKPNVDKNTRSTGCTGEMVKNLAPKMMHQRVTSHICLVLALIVLTIMIQSCHLFQDMVKRKV